MIMDPRSKNTALLSEPPWFNLNQCLIEFGPPHIIWIDPGLVEIVQLNREPFRLIWNLFLFFFPFLFVHFTSRISLGNLGNQVQSWLDEPSNTSVRLLCQLAKLLICKSCCGATSIHVNHCAGGIERSQLRSGVGPTSAQTLNQNNPVWGPQNLIYSSDECQIKFGVLQPMAMIIRPGWDQHPNS